MPPSSPHCRKAPVNFKDRQRTLWRTEDPAGEAAVQITHPREAFVEAVAGTVDEACVDELLAGYSEDELKAAVTDYSMNAAPSAESEALFNAIGQAAATTCAS